MGGEGTRNYFNVTLGAFSCYFYSVIISGILRYDGKTWIIEYGYGSRCDRCIERSPSGFQWVLALYVSL